MSTLIQDIDETIKICLDEGSHYHNQVAETLTKCKARIQQLEAELIAKAIREQAND